MNNYPQQQAGRAGNHLPAPPPHTPSRRPDGYQWGGADDPFATRPQPRQAAPTAPAKPPATRLGRRNLLIGVGAMAVVAGGSGTAAYLSSRKPEPAASPSSGPTVKLSRPAPPGWRGGIAWHVGIASAAAVASDGKLVAVADQSTLTVLDAETGAPQWQSSRLGFSTATPKVYFGQAEGRPVVAVFDSNTLYVWPQQPTGAKQGAEPEVLSAAAGLVTVAAGGGLMLASTNSAQMLTKNFTLESVPLPAGSMPLSITPDGTVVAAVASGPWSLVDRDGKTVKVTPHAPGGVVGAPHPAWSSRGKMALWWETKSSAQRCVAIADTMTGKLLASGMVPTKIVAAGLPLLVSPSGALASVGPLLVNLHTGATTVVEQWVGQTAADKALYGAVGGKRHQWAGKGAPEPLDAATAFPWGITAKGLAVVVDRTEGRAMVAGLRPGNR